MMSFGGPTGGAATAQRYFCHQCDRTVSISPSTAGDDLACPICNGGFVEELEYPNPITDNPSPAGGAHMFSFQAIDPFAAGAATGLPFFFSSAASSPASFDLRNSSDLSGLFGSEPSVFRSSSATAAGPEPFNPLHFLQNYIQTLMAGGANIQLVLEGPGGPIGGNLGDYFVGPGLEQLIQQLAENDPNRYGTPPASKSAIETLPTITITENLLSHDEAQCAVCKDSFEMGAEATQLPCKHIFHKDCILPWLELHNSCPVCRYELPTDDPDYEQRVRGETVQTAGQGLQSGGASSGNLGSGSTTPNSPGTRTVERRFRISLPWPFRAFASQPEGSSGGEGRDGNSGGHGGSGTQSRQEDLG